MTSHSSFNGCTTVHRHPGQIDYAATGYDLVASAIQEGIKTLCSAIPGIEIAPLGAGTEANPDDICGQAGTSEVGNHLSPLVKTDC